MDPTRRIVDGDRRTRRRDLDPVGGLQCRKPRTVAGSCRRFRLMEPIMGSVVIRRRHLLPTHNPGIPCDAHIPSASPATVVPVGSPGLPRSGAVLTSKRVDVTRSPLEPILDRCQSGLDVIPPGECEQDR